MINFSQEAKNIFSISASSANVGGSKRKPILVTGSDVMTSSTTPVRIPITTPRPTTTTTPTASKSTASTTTSTTVSTTTTTTASSQQTTNLNDMKSPMIDLRSFEDDSDRGNYHHHSSTTSHTKT